MKKLLVLLWVLLIPISYMAGNTYAWFSDSVTANAVIASGNIDIVQTETDRNGDPFEQGQMIAPLIQGTDENYIDKVVTIKNTGSNPAYVRTFFAVPAGGYGKWIHLDFNTTAAGWEFASDPVGTDVTISGTVVYEIANNQTLQRDYEGKYDIYVATYTKELISGQSTPPSLKGFYIDSSVSNDDNGGYYYKDAGGNKVPIGDVSDVNVIVVTQAAQTISKDLANNVYDAKTSLKMTFQTAHPWASEPPTNP